MLEEPKTWANTKIKFPACFNNSNGAFMYLMNLRQNSTSSAVHSLTPCDAPTDIQVEIIDLLSDSNFKEIFASVGV